MTPKITKSMESPPLEAYIAVKTLLQRMRHYDAKELA